MQPDLRAHSHYFKSVKGLEYIDVYRVLQLFEVTDPAIAHALKKLLVPGKRGAGKDLDKDVKEAIDSLKRWQEIRAEDVAVNMQALKPVTVTVVVNDKAQAAAFSSGGYVGLDNAGKALAGDPAAAVSPICVVCGVPPDRACPSRGTCGRG